MVKESIKVPEKVIEEIFPKKLKRRVASDLVYTQLKGMILAGKLHKGQKLVREEIVRSFDVTESVVSKAFSKLRKEGLIVSKGKKGSFVA